MASYNFRLLDVRVTVVSNAQARGPRFSAVVTGAGGEVIGEGADYSEPAAVGLAILAARRAYELCNGCGARFYVGDLAQDTAGLFYCGDCRTFGHFDRG